MACAMTWQSIIPFDYQHRNIDVREDEKYPALPE
jgi:hypothetical protein